MVNEGFWYRNKDPHQAPHQQGHQVKIMAGPGLVLVIIYLWYPL